MLDAETRPDPTSLHAAQPAWVRTLFSVFFVLFVVGGLYFGYLFYVTIREVTAFYNMPAPVIVPTAAPAPPGSAPPVALAPTPTPPPPPTPVPLSPATSPVWDRKGRVNILLLGTDEGRQCENGIPRTDTLMLLSLDPEGKRAFLISIPRDLWVEIPARGVRGIPREDRINVAYTYGEVARYPGGGAKLARDTVEKNFGQPIHYHAVVNLVGLRNMIDRLGGVEIDVKKPLYDDAFPTENCGVTTIQFKPGVQRMTGEQALAYARSRHTTSDFDRADRQQQVLLAMRRQALQIDIITKLPGLLAEYRNLVKTDLSPMEMLALANMAKDIETENIQRFTIGPDMAVDWMTPDGAQVLIPDRAKIRVLFDQLFNTPASAGN